MSVPSARERILSRVREAIADRPSVAHPGDFDEPRPEPLGAPIEAFMRAFEAAGGEVVRVDDRAVERWLREFAADFRSCAAGAGVPPEMVADLPPGSAESADLGVSMARCAVGETGSLVLGAEDGRRTQLLPPTHVVLVRADAIHLTLRDALGALRDDLPSGLGLHSGPSKSADIGQILVKGVHGPGRVVALVVG